MEFRKMVTITLCTRQQKRHWCIEQSFGLCGRGRGWDDLGEWQWNMYNIMYEMSRQSRFDARYSMLGAGALRWPRGIVWGGRREQGSGWGTHVYLWRIHFDIWQNQYNIVKFKNKIKKKIKVKVILNVYLYFIAYFLHISIYYVQSSCLKIISLEYLFLLFHQINTSIKLLAILLPQNSLVNIFPHFGLSRTLLTN